jgi:signal transduction histidine kinase
LGVAVLGGFLFGVQMFIADAVSGYQVSWGQAFFRSFGGWFVWALLAPVVFWLCRKFPFTRRRWVGSALAFLVGGVALVFLHMLVCALGTMIPFSPVMALMPAWGFREHLKHLVYYWSAFDLTAVGLIACAWHVWQYQRRVRERERELAGLGQQLVEAQLSALRMQLNPHFLFNTLNTISSLMLTDVRAANQVVSRLGALLREALEGGGQQEIALEREIGIALRYLEIEQVRFSDRLMVAVNVMPETFAVAVPAFLLQPLVENAVRHGTAQRVAGGRIVLRAERCGERLRIEIEDNGPGRPVQWPPTGGVRAGAIGLHNTRQRLAALYGERQSLVLAANELGGITVTIILPFRLLPPSP